MADPFRLMEPRVELVKIGAEGTERPEQRSPAHDGRSGS
jgi:hypothetical protein